MARGRIPSAEWLRYRYEVAGQRISEIAAAAGVGVDAIRRALDRLGVERRDERSGRRLPTRRAVFDVVQAEDLYLEHMMPCDQIGAIFGVHGCTVRRRLRERGVIIRHHNDTKRGAPARNRVDLNANAVISAYRIPGASIRSVGAQFGVSSQVVRRILMESGEPTKPPLPGRFAGAKNPNWRSDLTDEDRANRRDSAKQEAWRSRVYERDRHTCQKCGDSRGGNLNAHHIDAHAIDVERRWDVENGITLCALCHRLFHRRYGLKAVNRENLQRFLASREVLARIGG